MEIEKAGSWEDPAFDTRTVTPVPCLLALYTDENNRRFVCYLLRSFVIAPVDNCDCQQSTETSKPYEDRDGQRKGFDIVFALFAHCLPPWAMVGISASVCEPVHCGPICLYKTYTQTNARRLTSTALNRASERAFLLFSSIHSPL